MGLQAIPLPERHDGYPMLVGEAQDLHHLVTALRVDHGVGLYGCMIGEDTARMPFEILATGDDAALRQSEGELRERVHPLLRRDRVGEGAKPLYLDSHLISILQPHLRVAGGADAGGRAGNDHVSGHERHGLGEE